MGAEKVYISPFCTDPNHPRAIRSGMGCIETIPWERCSLEDLPNDLPIFALETGGTPLEEFEFPKKGIVIIGSEELGISPQALQKASYGRVTIPMKGIKSSLNVGVAFGILMQSWISFICFDSPELRLGEPLLDSGYPIISSSNFEFAIEYLEPANQDTLISYEVKLFNANGQQIYTSGTIYTQGAKSPYKHEVSGLEDNQKYKIWNYINLSKNNDSFDKGVLDVDRIRPMLKM